MYCKKCGVQLADNAVYCQRCGEKVAELTPSNHTQNEESSAQKANPSFDKEPIINSDIDDCTDDGEKKEAYNEKDAIETNNPDSYNEIKRLKHPIIPCVLSVLFLFLLIVFVLLLVNNLSNLNLASTNLNKNQPLQEQIHTISSDVDKNVTTYNEITSRLHSLTESYTSGDVSDTDAMISNLTSLEESLQSEYDEIGALYGEEYELFWYLEDDYTVEDRNNAIRNWKKSRQSKNDSVNSELEMYKSAEERAIDSIDSEINQAIVEEEADVNLKLALYYCQLNEYSFNDTIDVSINRAKNAIDSMYANIWGIGIATVFIAFFLILSVIKIFTYKKRKHCRSSRESYKALGVLLCIVLLFSVVASVFGTFNHGRYIENNSQIQQEIEQIDESNQFIETLDSHPSSNVYFAWENAKTDKAESVNKVLNRNRREQMLLLTLPYFAMLVFLTCSIDCLIKGSKPKSEKSDSNNEKLITEA